MEELVTSSINFVILFPIASCTRLSCKKQPTHPLKKNQTNELIPHAYSMRHLMRFIREYPDLVKYWLVKNLAVPFNHTCTYRNIDDVK
jgi:hypothetical protein